MHVGSGETVGVRVGAALSLGLGEIVGVRTGDGEPDVLADGVTTVIGLATCEAEADGTTTDEVLGTGALAGVVGAEDVAGAAAVV